MSAAVTISREFTSKLPFSFEEGQDDFEYNLRFYECVRDRRAGEGKRLMTRHFERSRELVERYRSMSLEKSDPEEGHVTP
jgi:hypothetical protein